jgi:hypothetical protein
LTYVSGTSQPAGTEVLYADAMHPLMKLAVKVPEVRVTAIRSGIDEKPTVLL